MKNKEDKELRLGFISLVNHLEEDDKVNFKKVVLKKFIKVENQKEKKKKSIVLNKRSLFEKLNKKNEAFKNIYYKYEIKDTRLFNSHFSFGSDEINKIFYCFLNNDFTLINNFNINHLKSILNTYFFLDCYEILDNKSINKVNKQYIYSCYYLYAKYLFIKIPMNKIDFDFNEVKSEAYISRVVSFKTAKELHKNKILKLKDLKNIQVNRIEYFNIKRYIYDLNNYQVNDLLFESICSKYELHLLINYIDINNFNHLNIINCYNHKEISVTTIRTRIYTIINKLISLFNCYEGVRSLNLLFSDNDNYILISKLKKVFPKYYKILIYLVKKNYLFNIHYLEKYLILINGNKIDDSFIFNKYKNKRMIDISDIKKEIKQLFWENNIAISKDIIEKRIILENNLKECYNKSIIN